MSRHNFEYMGIPVEYQLIRKHIKNINLRINEKEEIMVSAPLYTSMEDITVFVESRAEWILRNLAVVERYNQMKPDKFIYSGKTVFYCGNAKTIRIFADATKKISQNGDYIDVFTPFEQKSEELKKQYLGWLEAEAKTRFSQLSDKAYAQMQGEGIERPSFAVKNMKTRWGSCNMREGRITLNLQLMKSDDECVNQVICHELTHLRASNHGARFYAILKKYVPEYKSIKKRLETHFKDGI